MNDLDSRFLRQTDCFAQKLARPGLVRYSLTTLVGAVVSQQDEGLFAINVVPGAPGGSSGGQHQVTVRQEGRRLVAEPARLEISVGDMVLWNAPDASTPGYAVRGQGDDISFDSASLSGESVYTHAFGLPGEYTWVDANGSEVTGEVRVASAQANGAQDRAAWMEALRRGMLVTIQGGEVSPKRVEITVGQTVFFAVAGAPGITITDARLVHPSRKGKE